MEKLAKQYVDEFMAGLIAKNPNEPEFHQAVREVAESLAPHIVADPVLRKMKILERIAEPEAAESFTDEMIVFCHMTNAQLNSFLKTAKQQRIPPFPLKAILTPTNAEWTPVALCAELQEERAAILSGSQAHKAD